MYWLADSWDAIIDFLYLGGNVLRWIAVTIFLMWVLIIERLLFFRSTMSLLASDIKDKWEKRRERKSWHAHQIRDGMISRFSMATNEFIPMIQTLVALCPLLGLLGTVTGMITVFDVMAFTGGGDAKAMAGGVSQATIPTMSGMVAALSGVFGMTYIERVAEREKQLLEDHLMLDH